MRSTSLRKVLGLSALTFYGVGTIIGAGIYSVIGAAAGHAGDALWASFLLVALAAGLTALFYCEPATAVPRVGAEYVFVQRALPRWPALPLAVLISLGVTAALYLLVALAVVALAADRLVPRPAGARSALLGWPDAAFRAARVRGRGGRRGGRVRRPARAPLIERGSIAQRAGSGAAHLARSRVARRSPRSRSLRSRRAGGNLRPWSPSPQELLGLSPRPVRHCPPRSGP